MKGMIVTGSAHLPAVPGDWTIGGAADFDGDGSTDILWRNPASGSTYLWKMSGSVPAGGTVLPSVADEDWRIVCARDFTGNGSPDILWRHSATGSTYLWQMTGTAVTGGSALPGVPDGNWRIEE